MREIMRKIKFRGQYADPSKEWVYGGLMTNPRGQVFIGDMMKGWSVIPETVGQFTGLHDKNGKEIYEGDIIRNRCGLVAMVEFIDYGWYYHWSSGSVYPFGQEVEVIGNAYDNPELLKIEY